MNDVITTQPGEHATFTTIRTDEPAPQSVPYDDYIGLGELFETGKERISTLEAELVTATALIATLRNDMAAANQSLAIERRNVQWARDQLQRLNDDYAKLHKELSNARRANVAILPGDGFASEKQQDARPAIEQLAYPDQALAREAGVSEPMGEGEF